MSAIPAEPILFTPHLQVADPVAASWLAEITWRLRREICWLWYQRAGIAGNAGANLPPAGDATIDALELARYVDHKQRFFETDATARYLTQRIAEVRAARAGDAGPWTSVVTRLALDDAAQLVLALALVARADAAAGPVFGACHNDMSKTLPTLALAQRLHADPTALLAYDAMHPLFRFGLISLQPDAATLDWHQPFELTGLLAPAFLLDVNRWPQELEPLPRRERASAESAVLRAYAARLHGAPPAPQLIPLALAGGDDVQVAQTLAGASGRRLVRINGAALPEQPRLRSLAAWCWLHDVDVLLPPNAIGAHDHAHDRAFAWPAAPVRWFAPVSDAQLARSWPASLSLPACVLPAGGFTERVARFKSALGARAHGLDEIIDEIARRFRFDVRTIDAVAAALLDGPLSGEMLLTLCRTHARHDLGALAQAVNPRFTLDELVLPPPQARQLCEIVHAMRALTRVHYRLGLARAWNDGGLSVLFCGSPGTGKTMASEALAVELQLPMYRIDLSQVVNKYIGETEKNLKRVFDTAEASDCVLFFDEADALFGKRTDVKDAHDRFANIEISYLLERMERFKGIAVLATNRRKDLDEAFLRRLRYVIEFPLPAAPERERLWRYVFPREIDVAELDFAYLARQFQLAGGHIRSIALNACLQAPVDGPPKIRMVDVLTATKRELDKLNRPATLETFGPYRELVAPLFAEAGS